MIIYDVIDIIVLEGHCFNCLRSGYYQNKTFITYINITVKCHI